MVDESRPESPVPPPPDHAEEAARIATEYARRSREIPADRYQLTSAGPMFVRQATERAVVRALAATGMLPLAGRRVLEIGCGDGTWLLAFEAWGADRERLAGIDLLDDRVERARDRLSGPRAADLHTGNATRLPWHGGSFDIVFQSMMLSSIVDSRMRRAVAAEAVRVLGPDGRVISYDFCVDSPLNPRVRSVRRSELLRLFPGFEVHTRRAVIAPPVARRLAPISWTAAALVQATTLLNTQMVATLRQKVPNA